MQLISKTTNYDFLGKRYIWLFFSLCLTILTLYAWFSKGDEKFGVDFRGGGEFIVRFQENVSLEDLRAQLTAGNFPEAIVQNFSGAETDFSIRVRAAEGDTLSGDMKKVLEKFKPGKFQVLREDFVGPVIGEQIRQDAYIAGLCSLIGILIYLSIRFDWRFALGAMLSLFHDAMIATGMTVLFGVELGAASLAAVLTVIGYSVNDTVIVFDRIRENMEHFESQKIKKPLVEIMNLSLNQTLSRTIITSMTVFFVCFTLWILGGGVVSELAFTMLIGVLMGTYSSIFIACPLILVLSKKK
jgi:preprotein translocase subunit SecF